MPARGSADFKGMKKFIAKANKQLDDGKIDRVYRQVANEIAALLLNKVKERTPVGVRPTGIDKETTKKYWAGYTGGSLRDAWTKEPPVKRDDNYVVTVINNTSYAAYVEYGHRQEPGRYVPAIGKRLKAEWVKGQFMLTVSVQEVKKLTPRALEEAIFEMLKGAFG